MNPNIIERLSMATQVAALAAKLDPKNISHRVRTSISTHYFIASAEFQHCDPETKSTIEDGKFSIEIIHEITDKDRDNFLKFIWEVGDMIHDLTKKESKKEEAA